MSLKSLGPCASAVNIIIVFKIYSFNFLFDNPNAQKV